MRCKIKAATGLVDHRSAGLPPIWITDDILHSTFQRYVRFHNSFECRHFSHVPGPLEFRRRQAKRRMASATFYDAPTPPPTSWASTFDISSIIRSLRSPESQWTWQAPTASQWRQAESEEQADIKIDPHTLCDLKMQLSSIPDIAGLSALQWERCPIGRDAIAFSEASFQHVLRLAQDLRDRGSHNALALIVRFLESDVNDSAAMNIPVCFAWLEDNIPAHHVLAHAQFVKYMSSHVRQCDTTSADVGALLEFCQAALQAMSKSETQRVMASITSIRKAVAEWLCEHDDKETGSDAAAITAGLVNMLSSLPASSRSTATLVTHIAQLPLRYRTLYNEMAREHLLDWCRHDLNSTGSSRLSPLLQSIHSSCSTSSDSISWWLETMVNTTRSLIVHDRNSLEEQNMLQHWLAILKKPDLFPSSTFYQDLWAQISPVLASSDGHQAVMAYVSRPIPELHCERTKIVRDHHEIVGQSHTPKVAAALINECLDRGQVNRALRLFHSSPALTIGSCESLVFRLVDAGCTSDQLILSLLRRSNQRIQESSLTNKSKRHARLVENLAYHVSVSDKIDHRQAFRSVHKLYRYLRDRQIQPSQIMSRALVRAGVTRFLRDEVLVPRQRFIWITDVVSEIEGPCKSQHLDTIAGGWMHRVRETKNHAENIEGRRPCSSVRQPQAKLSFRRQYKPWKFKVKQKPNRSPQSAQDRDELYRLRGIASGYVVSEDKVLPVQTRSQHAAVDVGERSA